MERDGSGVSALLGLDAFAVRAQLVDETSGEWWLAAETTEDQGWCPSCGLRTVGHGRRRGVVRDLPLADRPVMLVWREPARQKGRGGSHARRRQEARRPHSGDTRTKPAPLGARRLRDRHRRACGPARIGCRSLSGN
jgi:hypothetical protein